MDKEKLAAPEAAVSNPASAPTTEATEEPEVDFNKLAPSSDRAATPEGNPGDRSDSEDKWAVKNKFNGVNLPTWIDELDNVYDHLSRLVLHGWMPAHYCDATEGFNAVRAQADKDLESVGLLWEIATCDMRVSCKVQLLREKLAQHSTAEQIRLGLKYREFGEDEDDEQQSTNTGEIEQAMGVDQAQSSGTDAGAATSANNMDVRWILKAREVLPEYGLLTVPGAIVNMLVLIFWLCVAGSGLYYFVI